MSVLRTMVRVTDSVTTLRGAFFASVEMDTTWMKMDISVMVKSVSDILMPHDGHCIYFHKLKANANALPYVKHPTIIHCHKYHYKNTSKPVFWSDTERVASYHYWGHCPPGKYWNFRRSEIDSDAFWDTCLSWQGTCYKLTIVYTCEKDCKYSTIINYKQWPTHFWNL